jgi:pyrroloquinoline quinone biosynthesis protein B
MRIRMLGSAAGGGFPQWNCSCGNCRGIREGTLRGERRAHAQLAISSDDEHWFLLGASPEICSQIESFPALWPTPPRESPITGIVLPNGYVEYTLGLLTLRESHPLVIHATDATRQGFTRGNNLYQTLQRFPGQITWRALQFGNPTELDDRMTIEAVPVPGRPPFHLPGAEGPAHNVALMVREGPRSLLYAPSVARPTEVLELLLEEADCVIVDGTFWSRDELLSQHGDASCLEEIEHWPVGGPGGSLETLARGSGRRILMPINNTNPILDEDSLERAAVLEAGVEVGFDGLEIELGRTGLVDPHGPRTGDGPQDFGARRTRTYL